MEQIARQLGLDPVEFRAAAPDRGGRPDGQRPALAEQRRQARCWSALAEHPLWKEREAWAKSGGKDGHGLRGTGLAIGGWVAGLQPTGATVRLEPGRHARRAHRPGRHRGHQHRPGADRRRRPTAWTSTRCASPPATPTCAPLAGLSAGSKTIYTVGRGGACEAAEDARRQTLEIAAARARGAVEDLEIEDGKVVGARRARTGRSRWPPSARRATPTCRRSPPVLGVSHNAFAGAGAGLRRPAGRPRDGPGHRRGHAARASSSSRTWARPSTRWASRARCRAARCRASASR